MEKVKIIELKEGFLADNDAAANALRSELKREKTCYVNLMSSPGSGKTSIILKTAEKVDKSIRLGVIEADIDSAVDAQRVMDAGIRSVQVHTGGMCHLDAEMSRQGLEAVDFQNLDLVILENVGNLVCPAEFDTGACINVVILSITEGDDKPLKYPLAFETCDVVLINKIDAMPAFDFNMDQAQRYIRMRNSEAAVFPVSAVTGEGMDAWCRWLSERVRTWNGGA